MKEHATVVDNSDYIEEIDAIILWNISVTAEMMDWAKKLKVIAKHGIGVNTIDVKAAKERGIQVIYIPTANADSVAEMTVLIWSVVSAKQISSAETESLKGSPPRISWVPRLWGKPSARLAWATLPNELPTS